MLGISRGTLRTALQRLQDSGEIVRRQGSGTFVGRLAMPVHLDERLERLEPYSSLARRRQLKLTATQLRIEERVAGAEVASALELVPPVEVTTMFRVLMASGEPAAVMFDVVHPSVMLPEIQTLSRRLEAGQMVLDLLIEQGLPIGFARTRVMPRLVTPREQAGKALRIPRATAALELEEVIYKGGGEPVAYSRDLFAPEALDVRVIRWLDADSPRPIALNRHPGRRARPSSRPAAAR